MPNQTALIIIGIVLCILCKHAFHYLYVKTRFNAKLSDVIKTKLRFWKGSDNANQAWYEAYQTFNQWIILKKGNETAQMRSFRLIGNVFAIALAISIAGGSLCLIAYIT